jgi:hypothetical protein
VRSTDTEWKEIYRDTGCNEPFGFAQFLAQDVLLVRSCGKVTILNADGKILFAISVPPKHEIGLRGPFGASSNGKRFATSIAELKRQPWWYGDPGYDRIHPTLVVYDTAGSHPVSSLTLNEKDEWPFGFALSADGSLVALLRGGYLELYRLTGESLNEAGKAKSR